MRKIKNTSYVVLLVQLILLSGTYIFPAIAAEQIAEPKDEQKEHDTPAASDQKKNQIIKEIVVTGNKYVKNDAILNRLPYKVGQSFDQEKSSLAINNLYGLGNFRQIHLEGESLSDKLEGSAGRRTACR